MHVKHQREKCCVNATVDYRYSAFQRSIKLCLAFELSWIFRAKQRTVSKGLQRYCLTHCKHHRLVFAVYPSPHLPYSQLFLLYLGIHCYVLVKCTGAGPEKGKKAGEGSREEALGETS